MNFSNLLDEMLTLPDEKRSEAKQIIREKDRILPIKQGRF